MARLPKVKLRAIPVFPSTVDGGNAIVVTKANGTYSIDFDVSGFNVSGVAEADELTTYAISWGGVTDDNPDGSFQLVPYASIQSSSDDLTTLVDLGTTGLVARIGDADYATRTLTAGTGLGVTNGNGVSGNPTVAVTDVELLALAGVTSSADKLFYFTGSGTGSLADFSSFARTLLDDANQAAMRTTLGLTPGTDVQAFDSDLAALAANSTDGLWAHTGAGTGAARTLTAPAAGITITNPAGIAGNPTLVLANDLAALEGMSSTGLVARTASETYAQRTITGTANQVIVTNGDGVAGNPTLSLAGSTTPQGRLTLVTATPVMTTTQSAKTTIYYSPYVGDRVPIHDGTNMVPTTFTELSVATTDTAKNPAAIGASKVNDWFVWNDSGTLRISHGPDWTSDTARSAGTALVMVKGILLNNASITNGPAASRGTYVGTTRSNGSSQLDWIFGASAAGGTAAFFGVWNMYNRVNVNTTVTDSTASWNTATSATFGPMNVGATGSGLNNRISAVSGLAEDGIRIAIFARINGVAVAFANSNIGFAMDATNTADKFARSQATSSGLQVVVSGSAENAYAPQTGFHFWQAVDAGDGTNAGAVAGGAAQGFSGMFRM